jgi:hypothetical protein
LGVAGFIASDKKVVGVFVRFFVRRFTRNDDQPVSSLASIHKHGAR